LSVKHIGSIRFTKTAKEWCLPVKELRSKLHLKGSNSWENVGWCWWVANYSHWELYIAFGGIIGSDRGPENASVVGTVGENLMDV